MIRHLTRLDVKINPTWIKRFSLLAVVRRCTQIRRLIQSLYHLYLHYRYVVIIFLHLTSGSRHLGYTNRHKNRCLRRRNAGWYPTDSARIQSAPAPPRIRRRRDPPPNHLANIKTFILEQRRQLRQVAHDTGLAAIYCQIDS